MEQARFRFRMKLGIYWFFYGKVFFFAFEEYLFQYENLKFE